MFLTGRCLTALLPVLAVLGYLIWVGSSSDRRPTASTARHLPIAEQRDLPLDEYGLAELCPDASPDGTGSRRQIRSRRTVELDALLRQLKLDPDVAVLARFTVADVPADKARVQQWTSLEALTRTHIDALRESHCAPAAATQLAALLSSGR